MTYEEFCSLSGQTVTQQEFDTINSIYMIAGDDIDKQTFAQFFKNKAGIVAIRLWNIIQSLTDKQRDIAAQLAHISNTDGSKRCRELCIKLSSQRDFIINTLAAHQNIVWDDDREYIKEHLI